MSHVLLPDIEPPDVLFNPQGYLLLSSEDEAESMEHDHKTQRSVLYVHLLNNGLRSLCH